jgi:hypothetical protein
MEIEFPGLRLRMPTVTFPRMFQSRDNAQMTLNTAHAPYVTGNFGAFPVMPAAPMPAAGMPIQAPLSAPIAPQNFPQQQPQQAPQQYPQNQPPYQAPLKAPDCQAQNTQFSAPQQTAFSAPQQPSLEQRLMAVEAAERRLDSKLQQIHQLCETLVNQTARPAAQPNQDLQLAQYAEQPPLQQPASAAKPAPLPIHIRWGSPTISRLPEVTQPR